ncbi:MAG TPA: hypothetical protein V6D50_26040 [Chroococcales cyanobacterium]|jgi:hypothetical protein
MDSDTPSPELLLVVLRGEETVISLKLRQSVVRDRSYFILFNN